MAKPTQTSNIDISRYTPSVTNGVWSISPIDVELIASGTGILGTGGGGSPYLMAIYTLNVLRAHRQGAIRVIALDSLRDEDLCVFGAGYGAPSVSDERISSGTDVFAAIDAVNTILGITDFQGIVADEIGGGNGLVTFPSSAHYNRPVVDCDLMGRAYPTLEHGTPYVYGQPVLPFATADCRGNASVVVAAESTRRVETMTRQTCIELGNSTAAAGRPLPGDVIKKYAVPNTVSQAWYLGRAVHLARQSKMDFIEAISSITPVKSLYTGKIIDVTRDISRGYTVGRCLIAPLSVEDDDGTSQGHPVESRYLVIPFQNEYLSAGYVDNERGDGEEDIICTVPDLISILGQDGEALGSPELRYGLKVRVIGMPAHPLWTGTPEGLKVGGPEFFDLPTEWKSVGEYRRPKSVIDEFNSPR